jgi:hypothetical protein
MIKQDPFFTTVQKEEEDPGKLPQGYTKNNRQTRAGRHKPTRLP